MFGFPPKEYALSALVSLLDETAPRADWMVSGLAVDIFDLIPLALEKGGHVRVGLEDAPFGSEKTNVQLVEDTRSIIERQGFELADAAEIRRSQAIERR